MTPNPITHHLSLRALHAERAEWLLICQRTRSPAVRLHCLTVAESIGKVIAEAEKQVRT